jgi:LysM repeat protein
MVDRPRPPNWTARLLAPIVFFAAVTLLILLVQSALSDEQTSPAPPAVVTGAGETGGETETAPAEASEPPAQPPAQPPAEAAPEPPPAETAAATTDETPKRQMYRVQSGDTLESIAARFDTTVADLLELNPTIDPLALKRNQRIRVR